MKINKNEKKLYLAGIICFTFMIIIKIFYGAGIGNLKMNNEKIRYEINEERKNVESLTMQVNELTSFDNVKDIVKSLGLAYNNDNIIVIGE